MSDVEKLKHDIRNMKTLTKSYHKLLLTLNKNELVDIIRIYDDIISIYTEYIENDFPSHNIKK